MFWKAKKEIAILTERRRRRGGKASKRGLSDEQAPILVAVDHSGSTTCSVLPSVTADNVQAVLEPGIDDDILLVIGGNNVYPPCAKSLGIKHESLNTAGERVRGAIHIQTVNNRHSRFKDFLHRFRGMSTKYLGNYLCWFERRDILKSSPRSYLATAIGDPYIQLARLSSANCRDGPIIVMTRYDLGGNFSRTYRSNHRK